MKQYDEENKEQVSEVSAENPPTEEETIKADEKRRESNMVKLREFDRHLKEAPKYQFNTNVFKHVKLAMD